MKKIFLLLIIHLLALVPFLQAQDFWNVLDVPNDFHGRSSATNSMGWLFLGTSDGVYRSIENGNNLEKIGLQYNVFSLIINSNNRILASSGIIYFSVDNGVNWQEITTPENAGKLYSNDTLIIFGNWGKLFKSSDFGNNWVQVLELNNTHQFTSIIKTTDRVLLAGEIGFMGGGGIYRSEDNGDTWEFSGLNDEYVSSMTINSEGVLFAGSRGNQTQGGGGVFKSEDNGNTWTELTDAIWVTSMVIDTNDVIYVGAEINSGQGGVSRSVDNGLTWERVITGMGQYPSVEGMCLSPNGYIYAYDTKLYRSVKPIYTSVDDNKENAKKSLFNIYPNPVEDLLSINSNAFLNSHGVIVKTYNSFGKLVSEVESENPKNQFQMDVSGLKPGIYIIHVSSGVTISVSKFVKKY